MTLVKQEYVREGKGRVLAFHPLTQGINSYLILVYLLIEKCLKLPLNDKKGFNCCDITVRNIVLVLLVV